MALFLEITFRGLYYYLTNKNYRRFIHFTIFLGHRKRNKELKLNLGNWQVTIADSISFIWQFKEIFADNSYFFGEKKEATIIDCGANIGISCLYYFLNYPDATVEAFEPDPNIFRILKSNTENLKGFNLSIHEKAVGIKDEELRFYQHEVDGGSFHDHGKQNSVNVSCIDLNKVLEKYNRIDFLKIDIEGAESTLIPHIQSSFHKIENMFIEYHSFPNKSQDLGEILSILEKEGFRYYMVTQNKRKSPFVKRETEKMMDYQTNIFAYKPI